MGGYNLVDYAIIGIFILSILAGFSRGGVKEIMSLVTLIAAFVIAGLFASKVAAYFTGTSQVQSVIATSSNAIGVNTSQQISWLALGFSFVGLFIITQIFGSIITSLLSGIVSGAGIGFLNRLLGGLFGFGRGFLINLLLIFLIQLIPQMQYQRWWTDSVIVKQYQPMVAWLSSKVAPGIQRIKSKVGGTLDEMNTKVRGAINSMQQ